MKILDSHPSFFALMQGHRKIEVNADEPLSEYWWMRLLMYNIFNHTPEISIFCLRCCLLLKITT